MPSGEDTDYSVGGVTSKQSRFSRRSSRFSSGPFFPVFAFFPGRMAANVVAALLFDTGKKFKELIAPSSSFHSAAGVVHKVGSGHSQY